MKTLMAALALSLTTIGSFGCTATVSTQTPAYYESRGTPVRVVSPGVRAYYIRNGWYVHRSGRWVRHSGVQGRVIIR